jgi:hypothetical protein
MNGKPGSSASLRVLFLGPGFTREVIKVGGRRKPGLYPTSTRNQQRKLPMDETCESCEVDIEQSPQGIVHRLLTKKLLIFHASK